MSYESTICSTCHAPDSYITNYDNQICTECGDTEGCVYESDERYEHLNEETQ